MRRFQFVIPAASAPSEQSLAAFLLDPAFFHNLLRSPDGQRLRGHILGNARRRANVRPFAELYWSDERRVTADKHAILNHGCVLVHTVVVAGDCSGANIYAFSNLRIAEISKMVCL